MFLRVYHKHIFRPSHAVLKVSLVSTMASSTSFSSICLSMPKKILSPPGRLLSRPRMLEQMIWTFRSSKNDSTSVGLVVLVVSEPPRMGQKASPIQRTSVPPSTSMATNADVSTCVRMDAFKVFRLLYNEIPELGGQKSRHIGRS